MSLMDWIPLAGAVLGGLSSKDKQTTTTADRAPWGPAQGWITQNIANGQNLQNAYMAQPFSQGQINAYGNSAALTDNFRSTANSLIPQISAQRQFDRTNPLARVTPYNYGNGSTGTIGSANSLGFTSQFGMNPVQQQQAVNAYNAMVGAGGLVAGDTGYSPGDFGGGSGSSQGETGGLSASQMSEDSPGSLSFGFDGKKGGIGFMTAGLPGLLAGVTMQQQAPVVTVMMPGLNGYGYADIGYGTSANAVGAPTAEQAAAIAAAFAEAMAAYDTTGSEGGGTLGDSGLGSAGNDGNDGAGGIGSW